MYFDLARYPSRTTMITGPAYMPPYQLSIHSGGSYCRYRKFNNIPFSSDLFLINSIPVLSFVCNWICWCSMDLYLYKRQEYVFIYSKICLIKSLPTWCSEVFAYQIQNVLRNTFSLQNKKMKSSFSYVSR